MAEGGTPPFPVEFDIFSPLLSCDSSPRCSDPGGLGFWFSDVKVNLLCPMYDMSRVKSRPCTSILVATEAMQENRRTQTVSQRVENEEEDRTYAMKSSGEQRRMFS